MRVLMRSDYFRHTEPRWRVISERTNGEPNLVNPTDTGFRTVVKHENTGTL